MINLNDNSNKFVNSPRGCKFKIIPAKYHNNKCYKKTAMQSGYTVDNMETLIKAVFGEAAWDSNGVYKCRCSEEQTYNAPEAIRHLQKNHVRQHVCSDCGIGFNSIYKLKNHMRESVKLNGHVPMSIEELQAQCDNKSYEVKKREIRLFQWYSHGIDPKTTEREYKQPWEYFYYQIKKMRMKEDKEYKAFAFYGKSNCVKKVEERMKEKFIRTLKINNKPDYTNNQEMEIWLAINGVFMGNMYVDVGMKIKYLTLYLKYYKY